VYEVKYFIDDYLISIYNSIQSDYSDVITSVYRREIVSTLIRFAVAGNTDVAESGATIVSKFIALMHCSHFGRALGIVQRLVHSIQKDQSSSTHESILRTLFLVNQVFMTSLGYY
jgi:hypothetical protein